VEQRCLGLVGGLGVGATIRYYEELVKAHAQRGLVPQLLIAHADAPTVLRYVQDGEFDRLAGYLAAFIDRLAAAGANVAAIGAVTPYCCAAELSSLSPLPVVNILQEVADQVRTRRIRRAAIFGTRFTMETRLFGTLNESEAVKLKLAEFEYVRETYVQLVEQGSGTDEQYRGLRALAHRLCDREGAEAIILAGTELSLIFNESNTDFANIDCTRVHINAIMRSLFEGESG